MGLQDNDKDAYRRDSLAYGSEAVISVEVRLTSYRVGNYDESRNDEAVCRQLDLVDEVKAMAEQKLARY